MTLILAAVTKNLIMMSGDRRVSRARSDGDYDFAIAENKLLLVHASDAIALMGCAGLAHVHGKRTDDWLAGLLFGRPVDLRGNLQDLTRHHRDIGFLLRLVNAALRELPAPGVKVEVAGWKRKRAGVFRRFLQTLRGAEGLVEHGPKPQWPEAGYAHSIGALSPTSSELDELKARADSIAPGGRIRRIFAEPLHALTVALEAHAGSPIRAKGVPASHCGSGTADSTGAVCFVRSGLSIDGCIEREDRVILTHLIAPSSTALGTSSAGQA